MNPPRICAITGSNGYVGGCVKTHFATRGWTVRELTRQPRLGTDGIAFQLGADLAPAALAGVDTLVHCAYDFRPLTWAEIQAVNVAGAEKVFAAAQMGGVKNLVCISSISAYPGCRSLYGKAKLAIEKIARAHGALVIRPGLVYGDAPGGMFGNLTQQIGKSAIVPLIGDGSQIQFLVHEQDLCAFIGRAVSSDAPLTGGLFTAAHPRPWPFKQLLQAIAHAQGKRISFIPLPWRLVWAGLKMAETCGLRLNFRSDSLVSLMHQNPAPDFSANAGAGLVCRPFPG